MTDPRRQLPSIDALLAGPGIAALLAVHPRALIVKAARAAVDAARDQGGTAPAEGWDAAVRAAVARLAEPSLVPVINATGVVLHTNLGRAPLADAAIAALTRVARGYAALEYDMGRGTRGSRHAHCRDLLVELTGAADALVVNNAAGAVLLALSALARGGDAIVSRGELVEIGGSFRIPDIMARSGARLVEVGTTNRTHPHDYERALTAESKVLLKVHRSNFQVTGFTADVAVVELAELAHARGIACLYDLGSGLLINLSDWGLSGEPTVPEAVAAGADLTVFSGDKLLGGPQAGILVGSEAAIAACRADPIARTVRADKLTLSALEATLALYRDHEAARQRIPVLRMLTEPLSLVKQRAEAILKGLHGTGMGDKAQLVQGDSEVGGGSFPGVTLKTWLVGISHAAPDSYLAQLRSYDPPIIARVAGSRVLLDARTIFPEQVETVIAALRG
ncbi:MAG TPA: L-seryl-tRNA(Sec) selenium transferase [Gemmatimonadales bacterium]|nr:L-seryl-tRNA(Sec) selenium transferase [Gemmatimonadales bacterium]